MIDMVCECSDNKKLNNDKRLSLESMKVLSIDEIINLYRQGYRLGDTGQNIDNPIIDNPIIDNQIYSPSLKLSPKISISSLGNCPMGNIIQGTTKTITIEFPGGVVGGIAPYTYRFYRDGSQIHASSPITASSYQFQYIFSQANGDTTGPHRYLTNVTDNCSAGSQTSGSDWCDITIQSPITVGNVTFHTNPAGAHIIIGGVDKGATSGSPTDGTLTVNDLLAGDLVYDVTLTGYNPSIGNHVTVQAGTTVNAPLVTLTPITPGTGAVRFHTNPGLAEIWKGTTLLCTTDSSGVCAVTGQPVGTLTFVVKKSGYLDSSPTDVTVVQDTTTDAPLVTLSPRTGSVRFHTSPGGAEIWSGVDNLGTTDAGGVLLKTGLSVGTWFFIAKKTGYIDSAQQSVTVVENTTVDTPLATLTPITAGKGSVIFHTVPGQADIWVGVTKLGTTNISGNLQVNDLDIGTLTFVAKRSGYYDSSPTDVTVVEGSVTDASTVTLTAIPGAAGGAGGSIIILAAVAIGIAAIYMMKKPKLPGS